MRRPLSSLLVAAVLLAVAGCGSSDDTSGGASGGGPQQVKVGIIPILDVAPTAATASASVSSTWAHRAAWSGGCMVVPAGYRSCG